MIFGYELALAEVASPVWDWPVVVAWMAFAGVVFWLLRSLATLLHELGHAIPALLLTSEEVELQVGRNSPGRKEENGQLSIEADNVVMSWRKWGRLRWSCSFPSGFEGFTGYDRESLGKGALLLVIAGGPVVSGLASGLGAWLTFEVLEGTWERVSTLAFVCANFNLFLRSIVPVMLENGKPSDGLDFWKSLWQAR